MTTALIVALGFIMLLAWALWLFCNDVTCATPRSVIERPEVIKVTPVDPVPAPPELSCFVKGIIRSMREHPEEWTVGWQSCYHIPSNHKVADLMLKRTDYQHATNFWYVKGQDISDAESVAIEAQGIAFLRQRQQAETARQKAAIRAPFERLGCPPSDSASSS